MLDGGGAGQLAPTLLAPAEVHVALAILDALVLALAVQILLQLHLARHLLKLLQPHQPLLQLPILRRPLAVEFLKLQEMACTHEVIVSLVPRLERHPLTRIHPHPHPHPYRKIG